MKHNKEADRHSDNDATKIVDSENNFLTDDPFILKTVIISLAIPHSTRTSIAMHMLIHVTGTINMFTTYISTIKQNFTAT